MDRKVVSNIICGILLILIGIFALGHSLGVLGAYDENILLHGWWTLFLIVPAIRSIICSGFRTGNCTLLLVGGWLYLQSTGIIGYHGWTFFGAGLLIIYGLLMMTGRYNPHRHYHNHHGYDGQEAYQAENNADYSSNNNPQ